jgi:hypothetical protein
LRLGLRRSIRQQHCNDRPTATGRGGRLVSDRLDHHRPEPISMFEFATLYFSSAQALPVK